MMLLIGSGHFEEITQKYLISGHSFLRFDRDFALTGKKMQMFHPFWFEYDSSCSQRQWETMFGYKDEPLQLLGLKEVVRRFVKYEQFPNF